MAVRTSKSTVFNSYKGYAMKSKLATAGLLMGALLLPVVGYTAEKAPAGRSDQPVDDTVITTTVKARFVKDKQVRARNIEVKTVNGVVELSGTAASKQEASRAASIARNVKGVKSVKNDIQVSAKPAAAAREKMSDKDRPATAKGSDQPVADSVITAKLKALFVKDKDVSFRTIEVKTVNGVVHLSGTAKSKQESDKAVSMARDVQGVKSVKNDIRAQ
jgi:hyperosmotically inducible protein